MTRILNRRLVAAATLVAAMATLLLAVMPALSDGPMYARDERFGIAFVSEVPVPGGYVQQSISDYAVRRFGVGWYSDWKYAVEPAMPSDQNLEYAQLVRVRDQNWVPDWALLQQAVLANPGSLWMIGNEPECPNQDNLTPQVYAERYHALYGFIKGLDATAQIANGGIVEPTPLRLRWLDAVLAHYQTVYGTAMPVDVWNIHMQILPEWGADDSANGYDYTAFAGIPVGFDPVTEGTSDLVFEPVLTSQVDPLVFESMVQDFRDWMKANGQQQKPLIISEMGVLFPSIYLVEGGSEAERQERGDQAIEAFMRDTFEWMLNTKYADVGLAADENRLVQRWIWFSLNGSYWADDNQEGFNGSLYDYQAPHALTRFGWTHIGIQSDEGLGFLPLVSR